MFPSGFSKEMWLIQIPGSEEGTHTLINPLNKTIEEKHAFEMAGKTCSASFEEWLFLVDDESEELVLFNLNSMVKVFPPPLNEPFESLGSCVLSLPPTSPDCIIAFSAWEDNFLLICYPNDNKWTKFHLEFTGVHTMLAHNNQLIVFITNEVVIIDIPSIFTTNVQITRIDKPDWWNVGCGMNVHLLESCGDLFLVRMITAAIGPPVLCFDIHRFDPLLEENWVRMESISNRAIFLARDSGISCCAKDVGVQDDCIYCVMSGYDGERFYKFCLSDQTMSFKLLPSNLTQENYSFNWVLRTMPKCVTSSDCITSSEVCQLRDVQKEVIREIEDGIFRPWADLPLDLVQLISEYLPLKECGSLPVVCSAWRSLSNPVQEAQVWLMYSPKENGNCLFFDPFQCKIHELYVGYFSGSNETRFRYSKDGWIVVSEGYSFYYLLNPFTEDYYQMPIFCDYPLDGITFSSVPGSPSCVVFAISGVNQGAFVDICTWKRDQEEWSIFRFDCDPPFYVEQNNPIFFHGEFYCLGITGALGVFNPENNTWRVLDRLAPIYSEKPMIGSNHCYLVEARGDLISVFREISGDNVRVFRLDLSKMVWIEINDLGDLTLFLDYRSSIARSFSCCGYKNKLYLPRLHDKADATAEFYYSMESGKHSSNFKSLKEPYNCVWFEPNLDRH